MSVPRATGMSRRARAQQPGHLLGPSEAPPRFNPFTERQGPNKGGAPMKFIKKPLAAIGIAAGSFGLAFGIGMAVSQAATSNSSTASTTATSTATTTPAST